MTVKLTSAEVDKLNILHPMMERDDSQLYFVIFSSRLRVFTPRDHLCGSDLVFFFVFGGTYLSLSYLPSRS